MESKETQNRRVLIVGASGAIGASVAKELDTMGFSLTLHARSNLDKVSSLAKTLSSQSIEPDTLQFDVGKTEQCREVLEEYISARSPFYGVVLSAGFYRDVPFPAMTADDWHEVINVNLNCFFNVLQPLILPMIQLREGGRIVVISSLSGIVGNRGQANYSAAKAGLIAASKSLSKELAKRKITVNCIAPGFIESEMTEELPKDLIQHSVPMQRAGTPKEVASCVGYLFSQNAEYITGQVISMNGGIA